jgi:putative spermidine/putrescine transport system permease protein
MIRTPAERAADLFARSLFRFLQATVLVFLLLPVVLVFGFSFFEDVFENFPPHEFTFDLYRQLAETPEWREAIVFSLKLGIPTAILTVLMVAPAALALERAKVRGKAALEFTALLPLLMPATGYALALYVIYLQLGWVGSYFPLVLAQSIVATPIVFLILRAALQRIPHRLDFVAMSLGASRARALWDVSFTLLRPAMLVGSLFALINVFDDALYITFLGGPDTVTVSKAIFEAIEFKLEPVVGALSASFTVVTTLLVVTAVFLRGGPERGR